MSGKKTPKNRKVEKKLSPAEKWFSIIVFIAVAALIAYPPYFRGLFFSEDMFVFHVVSALVFILVLIDKISRRSFNFMETPLDWAVLAYAGAYLLSLTGAVHFGEAVYAVLKAINFFMVYWMVSNVIKNYTDYTNILRIMVATGTGIALVGLLAATGHCNYPSAFDGQVILSTLQYRNATGAYLVVMTFIAATLWIREPKSYLRPLYSTAGYLMLLVVLGTMSKGSWAVFIFGSILFLLGMPGKYRIKSVYMLGISGAAALLTALKFLPAITAASHPQALPYLLIGLAVVATGELLWHFVVASYISQKRAITAIIVILLLVIAAAGISSADLFTKNLQGSNLATQFSKITNTQDPSFTLRQDHYRWAWGIIKDHPVIGTGAGGWNALYHQYQDYLFWTTEVHNHFLQVLVETGLIGLLAFLSMWFFLILAIYKRWKAVKSDLQSEHSDNNKLDAWVLNWGTAAAAMTAGAHAAIDFDLSLGAVVVMLWSLFALINAGARIDRFFTVRPTPQPWIGLTIGAIIAVIIMVTGQRMAAANTIFTGSTEIFNKVLTMQEGPAKVEELQKLEKAAADAESLDSLNAKYSALLVQTRSMLYPTLAKNNAPGAADCRQQIQAGIQRTLDLSPYDVKIRGAMFNAGMIIQDYEGLLNQSRYIIKMNPYDANSYNNLINICLSIADQNVKAQQIPDGVRFLKEAVSIGQDIEKWKQRINPNRLVEPYWRGAPLALNPDARFSLGKAHFLLGDYPAASAIFAALIKEQAPNSPQVIPWQLAAQNKTGAQAEIQPALQSLRTSDPQSGAMYDYLVQLKPLEK